MHTAEFCICYHVGQGAGMSQPLAFLGLAWYFYQARGKQPEVVNDVALVDVPVETEVTSAEVQEVSIVAPISLVSQVLKLLIYNTTLFMGLIWVNILGQVILNLLILPQAKQTTTII